MNDEHVPLKMPMNMNGMAAGIPILSIEQAFDAPRVAPTSKYEFLMFAIPFAVSTVVGNHTASAIRKLLAIMIDGNTTSTMGIHAVGGIGPRILTKG